VAGTVANKVHHGASPLDFKPYIMGLAVFIVILSAGPLTIFIHKLRGTKRRGTFGYGAVAGKLGHQFESKWIKDSESIDKGALDVPDFSATTDLYSVVANVYQMKDFTFGVKNLAEVVVAGLVPFIPIALMVMPSSDIKGTGKTAVVDVTNPNLFSHNSVILRIIAVMLVWYFQGDSDCRY